MKLWQGTTTVLLLVVVALLVAHVFQQREWVVERRGFEDAEERRDVAEKALADAYLGKFDALGSAMEKNTQAIIEMKQELLVELQREEPE